VPAQDPERTTPPVPSKLVLPKTVQLMMVGDEAPHHIAGSPRETLPHIRQFVMVTGDDWSKNPLHQPAVLSYMVHRSKVVQESLHRIAPTRGDVLSYNLQSATSPPDSLR
jgi:hypothetical protein